MLSVEVQFQIETLYSGGLNHLTLPDLITHIYWICLKLSIRQEIAALPQKTLERALQDFGERL
jgi:hypothetical protein